MSEINTRSVHITVYESEKKPTSQISGHIANLFLKNGDCLGNEVRGCCICKKVASDEEVKEILNLLTAEGDAEDLHIDMDTFEIFYFKHASLRVNLVGMARAFRSTNTERCFIKNPNHMFRFRFWCEGGFQDHMVSYFGISDRLLCIKPDGMRTDTNLELKILANFMEASLSAEKKFGKYRQILGNPETENNQCKNSWLEDVQTGQEQLKMLLKKSKIQIFLKNLRGTTDEQLISTMLSLIRLSL
jgi:hypothetical protein